MMDTIYEKYQSLVPVVMFNEYFASGRVKNLPEAMIDMNKKVDWI